GATDLAGGLGGGRPRRDGHRAHDRAGRPAVARAPGRAARGCAADRRGRVLDRAGVLDRVRPRRRPGRPAGGPAHRAAAPPRAGPGGEVSGYRTEGRAVGSPGELRGPVGGWFVWDPDGPASTRPVLLVAGGSGVVPLMAMIRERAAAGSRAPFKLIYSVRDPG